MKTHQKRTYLVYSRGLMRDDLKLGSLYIDPANPLEGEHKRFLYPLQVADLHDWTGDPDINDSCVLNFKAGHEWLADAGVLNFLKGGFKSGSSEMVRVEGKKGRRFQIKNPETFLNQAVLELPLAKAWLEKQLSISRKMHYLSLFKFGTSRYPKIWLVTGVQYITDASVKNGWSNSSNASLGFTVPIPEPASAAATMATGQGGLSMQGSFTSNSDADIAYHHDDERVWAAQFTPLNVKFVPRSETGDETTIPKYIKLRDLEDLSIAGVRSGIRHGESETADEVAEISEFEEQSDEPSEEVEAELIEANEGVDWDLFDEYLELEFSSEA